MEVAVAIIRNNNGQILLTDRQQNPYLSDFWELPGGKIEIGETVVQALQRELLEELAIKITNPKQLISTFTYYSQELCNIHGYLITDWQGEIKAQELQNLVWISNPSNLKILPASQPIFNAYNFSDKYLITPTNQNLTYLTNLLLSQKNLMVQYRDNKLTASQYLTNAECLIKIAQQQQHKILLTTDNDTAKQLGADGVHWNSGKLKLQTEKPADLLVSTSCHNVVEIKLANKLKLDMVLLSPIQATNSHPELTKFLTWQGFADLVKLCSMPSFALGGVSVADITQAKNLGGQGIAGISAFTI